MLTIDIETYSSVDIKNGVYAYVEAPDFEILMLAYNWDGDKGILDFTQGDKHPDLMSTILSNGAGHTHAANAQFERVCLSKHFGIPLHPSAWRCTLVRAASFGLPGSLGGVAEALDLQDQKDKDGKALIRYFCMPCKPTKANGGRTRNLPHHAPEKWERFKLYCQQDVATEVGIDEWLDIQGYDLSAFEWALYALDQKINDRGMALDMDLVNKAISIDAGLKAEALEQMRALTGLNNPASGSQLLDWLALCGIDVGDTTAATVQGLLDGELAPNVREVLLLKQLVSKTSNAKYTAMLNSVCSDGRVRGLLQHCGAGRTGRWAGRVVQVQNLPRTYIKDIDSARETVKTGDAEYMQMMYANAPGILSQLIRTAFVGDLVVADYSAIEARVLAWLAGEQWRLDVFNSHGKIYEASASAMFGVPLEEIGKGHPLRQKGKIAELALGYGGGVSALVTMGALDMGLENGELQPLVDAWRMANPAIVRFWKDCNQAGLDVLSGAYRSVRVGRVTFKPVNDDLHIILPSGRPVVYHRACVAIGTKFQNECVEYRGMNQYTRKWERQQTYGGKLVENITQAVARDCLAHCMVELDKRGFDIIGHVHDEVIAEGGDLEEMCAVMGEPIPWAPGLPLRGEGYTSPYYKKD